MKTKSRPFTAYTNYKIVSTMNLNESHSYAWGFCRCFGVCYLLNSKNRLKITNKPLLVGLIVTLAVIFGYYTTQFEPLDQESYGTKNSIMFIVLAFGVLSQFWNCFVILISPMNQRQRALKFYEKLSDLDMVLQNKLGIQFDYKKLKNNNLKDLLTVSVLYIIVSCVLSYVFIMNITYVPFIFVFNFFNGAEVMNSYDYYYCTKLIKYRFRALNGHLIDSMETSKMNPCKLEEMIKCHSTLNNLIKDLNQIYGLKMLLRITNNFVLILSQACGVLIAIEHNFNSYLRIKYLCGLLTVPFLIIKMVIIAKACEDTVAVKNMFGKLLRAYNKIETNLFNQTISDLVKLKLLNL